MGLGPAVSFSADIPECLATDSAGQRYLPQDVFGECSLEQNCDTGPPSFMKRWTYSVGCPFPSNCCHTPPPPPCTPVPVSDVVSFLFYTRLYDEDISSDSIELEHEVEIDVQCDECDGTLIPKMISSKADITKNAFDSGYILPLILFHYLMKKKCWFDGLDLPGKAIGKATTRMCSLQLLKRLV